MCMVDGADDDFDYRTEPTVGRARKSHRCDECSREIAPGEEYERMTFFSDGHGSTFKTCEHCKVARSWLRVVCTGWLYGGVHEDLVEHWHESPAYRSLHLGRLIVGMRRRWARRDGGGLLPLPVATTRDMVPVAA